MADDIGRVAEGVDVLDDAELEVNVFDELPLETTGEIVAATIEGTGELKKARIVHVLEDDGEVVEEGPLATDAALQIEFL